MQKSFVQNILQKQIEQKTYKKSAKYFNILHFYAKILDEKYGCLLLSITNINITIINIKTNRRIGCSNTNITIIFPEDCKQLKE